MKICPNCHTYHTDETKFCNVCGLNIEHLIQKYCPDCGGEVTDSEAQFCTFCGLKFDDYKKPLDNKPVNVCRHCGFVIGDKDATMCYNCQNPIDDDENKPVDIANGGFDKIYYRVCTRCGASYEISGTNCVKTNCDMCGQPLNNELRDVPGLTEEEERIKREEEERLAEEIRQAEEKRQKEEEERRKKEEAEFERIRQQELAEAEARAKRNKKISIISGACVATVVVVTVGSFVVCNVINNGRIEKINTSLANGDYVSALDYCSRKMPVGKSKDEIENMQQEISTAASFYETAKAKLANYQYLDAMKYADSAMQHCPELSGPQEVFDTAKSEIARYYQKLYDAGDYKGVLSANNIYSSWRTDELTELVTNVNNLIYNSVTTGNEQLKNGKASDALQSAKSALAVDDENAGAKDLERRIAKYCVEQGNAQLALGYTDAAQQYANTAAEANENEDGLELLKNNISIYNEAMYYVRQANYYYSIGDYSTALENINKAFQKSPMVERNQQSVYDTISTAYEAQKEEEERQQREINNNPIIVTSKSSKVSGRYCYVYMTLYNRSSRNVRSVKVKGSYGYDNTKLYTNYDTEYNIAPGEYKQATVRINIGGSSYSTYTYWGSVQSFNYD